MDTDLECKRVDCIYHEKRARLWPRGVIFRACYVLCIYQKNFWGKYLFLPFGAHSAILTLHATFRRFGGLLGWQCYTHPPDFPQRFISNPKLYSSSLQPTLSPPLQSLLLYIPIFISRKFKPLSSPFQPCPWETAVLHPYVHRRPPSA
jgi:hypothetical protein